jgi:hypothetical protein
LKGTRPATRLLRGVLLLGLLLANGARGFVPRAPAQVRTGAQSVPEATVGVTEEPVARRREQDPPLAVAPSDGPSTPPPPHEGGHGPGGSGGPHGGPSGHSGGPSTITLGDAMPEGPLRFANTLSARPLTQASSLARSARSFRYLGRVGGVAFGAVASPKAGTSLIGVRYDPTADDGRRLVAKVRVHDGPPVEVRTTVPDWVLVPTARFAATDQDAAFTLFGEVVDAARGEEVTARGGRILNYHAAFQNTLLGLRLFQADVLILYPQSADLPKGDGRYLLGSGETAPDVAANRSRLRTLHQELTKQGDFPFRSYVIGDYLQKVVFSVNKGELVLAGAPYWHCWTVKPMRDAERERVMSEARATALSTLKREPAQGKHQTNADAEKRFNELLDDTLSRRLLQLMPDYSRKLSDRIRALDGVNPAVYGALTSTMRLSAFFRYFRKKAPASYEAFVKSLEQVSDGPTLQTPTTMGR